tara:strand:- start:895 stop:1167 length:273 start_codon:yes stop_codon:yes gene_type:complete
MLYYYPIKEFAILFYFIALGFAYQLGKKNEIGFFGGKVYWPRMLHSLIYFAVATMLMFDETRDYAYMALAGDVGLGFLSHTKYHLSIIET